MSVPDSILTTEQLDRMKRAAEKAVAGYITNMPRILEKHFTDVVMSTMGFCHDYGKYKVDSCNGRKSVVGDFIVQATRDEAVRLMNEMAVPWLEELRTDANLQEGLKREFLARYQQVLRETIIQEATKLAQHDAFDIAGNLAACRFELPLIITELANPASFQGEIGEAMLENQVRTGVIKVGDAT